VAFLLTGDHRRALNLAAASLRHAFATWRDLRGPDELESFLLHHVIRRASRFRRPSSPASPGFRAWASLGRRRRAALALVLAEARAPEDAARILECSRATVDALVRKGLAQWVAATGSPGGDGRARLEAWLMETVAEIGAESAAPPSLGPLGLLRAAGVAGALVVAAALTAGTLASGYRLLAPPAETDSSTARDARGGRAVQTSRPVGLAGSRRDWCPDPDHTVGFGPRPRVRAARAALAFNTAVLADDWHTMARLIDPSPLALGLRERKWDATSVAKGLTVTYSEPATHDEPVLTLCGSQVAGRSWKVVMHDAKGINHRGVAAFYLVRRTSGWKVWGSY
jgi:hypothetical protein